MKTARQVVAVLCAFAGMQWGSTVTAEPVVLPGQLAGLRAAVEDLTATFG